MKGGLFKTKENRLDKLNDILLHQSKYIVGNATVGVAIN